MIASASTIRDVAREAGVSETSVSLAFRENSRLGDRTRARILEVAGRLDYVPNLAARNLRSGRSDSFGFLVNDATNPFYAAMLQEANGIAEHDGFNIIFAGSDWDADRETELVQQMVQARIRGLLLCLRERDGRAVEILKKYRVPYVVVDSYSETYDGPFVANDFARAADLAAAHLLEIGCRHPVLFTSNKDKWTFSAFARIRRQFATRLKLPAHRIVPAGLTIAAGRRAFDATLKQGVSMDGVFCANDLCALGVLEAAERRGLRVGRDLAVIGIDDMPVSALSRVSLTSIRQPYMDIARLAMDALVKGVRGNRMPTLRQELAPEIVCRKSTLDFEPR